VKRTTCPKCHTRLFRDAVEGGLFVVSKAIRIRADGAMVVKCRRCGEQVHTRAMLRLAKGG